MIRRNADDYRCCAERGLTMAETAEHLGVSVKGVRLAMQRHGLTFSDEPASSGGYPVVFEGVSYRSVAALAKSFDLSERVVWRLVKDNRLCDLRAVKQAGGIQAADIEVRTAKLRELATAGLKRADVAAQLGCTEGSVSKMCKRLGITPIYERDFVAPKAVVAKVPAQSLPAQLPKLPRAPAMAPERELKELTPLQLDLIKSKGVYADLAQIAAKHGVTLIRATQVFHQVRVG